LSKLTCLDSSIYRGFYSSPLGRAATRPDSINHAPGCAPAPNMNKCRYDNGVEMLYSRFDRAFRKVIPSVGKLSYNPIVKVIGDSISDVIALPFAELRDLPANHLRIRIGVGNRIFANHVHFVQMGSDIWYCAFNSDIVELGCGCGRIAYPLKGQWFEGTFVGVDIDEEMISYCRQKFPGDRFKFVLSEHRSKTYSSNSHNVREPGTQKLVIGDTQSKDFIYSISLYSHLLEKELDEYLRETYRLLRPGGLMYLTFFCMEHVKLGNRWTFSHQRGSSYIEDERYPEAAVAYRQDFIKDLIKAIGFSEVSVIPRDIQSALIARK
jgi:SAM-dependent methyltransferase